MEGEEGEIDPEVVKALSKAKQNTNWLSLIGANLVKIPSKVNVENFPLLTQLYLGHNRLKSVPENLFLLTNLRGLYLQNNLIERMPLALGHLTDLNELYISNNELVLIPSTITNLVDLDCLW